MWEYQAVDLPAFPNTLTESKFYMHKQDNVDIPSANVTFCCVVAKPWFQWEAITVAPLFTDKPLLNVAAVLVVGS